MSDIFCVHFEWVYTVSQGLAVILFIMVWYIQELLLTLISFNEFFALLLLLLSLYMSYLFCRVL